MWHRRHIRHTLTFLTVLAVLGACLGTAAQGQTIGRSDPVDDLHDALLAELPFGLLPNEKDKVALTQAGQRREKILTERIDALKTLGQLSRAMALIEWKDSQTRLTDRDRVEKKPVPGEGLDVDQRMRAEVGRRFQKGVQDVVRHGDFRSKQAVAHLLAEMGTKVRALDHRDQSGFTRSLTPELVELTRSRTAEVTQAAARALGKVNPEPAVAAAALGRLLQTGTVPEQRAAAQGLFDMIYEVSELWKKGKAQQGVEADRDDVVKVATAVAAVTAEGLGVAAASSSEPKDVVVRRLVMAALLQTAQIFNDLVPEPYHPERDKEIPPMDRRWTRNETDAVQRLVNFVEREKKEFQPMVEGMRSAARHLGSLPADPDPQTRLLTSRALEMMASARQRLYRRIDAVQKLKAGLANEAPAPQEVVLQQEKGSLDMPPADMLPTLKLIEQRLRDPDVRVRRAAVDALEMLENAASTAIPALAAALRDPDRFVRWAAARSLGRMKPLHTEITVPALACLLTDPDLDVRLTAADALQRYGPEARAAVPALLHAAQLGDAEARVAAMQALMSVGIADAQLATPVLVGALRHDDARVRRTAAEVLGRMGPAAANAVNALQGTLNDSDAEVRRAAADAILSILAPPPR